MAGEREFAGTSPVVWMIAGHVANRSRVGDSRQWVRKRVVFVSDDSLFVETTSLGFRADPRFLVFHCLPSARPLLQAGRIGADVVMIDAAAGSGDWLDLITELSSQPLAPPVLVLSDLIDGERDLAALDAGARMVLSRQILGGSLVGLVAALTAGHVLVPRDSAQRRADAAPTRWLARAV